MAEETIDLGKSTLTFEKDQVAHLHIKANQIVETDEVKAIFEVINGKNGRFRLLVTADEQAALSPEAREYASSAESTDKIVADAVVVQNYSHEMTANFFIRFNKPNRPTRLFKHRDEAYEWLKTFAV
jgi:hypothetical protein